MVHTALKAGRPEPVAEALLLPGLCVIAGAMGSTLRNLMLRFGAATEALTTARARLAAAEAVSAERARLAREMHDSVAKTLYGVALAADGLAATASAGAPDPARIRRQAELVSRSARRAAAESRELLADLRRDPERAPGRSRCGDSSPTGPGSSAGAPAWRSPATGQHTTPPPSRPCPRPWPGTSSPSPPRPWRTPTATRAPAGWTYG